MWLWGRALWLISFGKTSSIVVTRGRGSDSRSRLCGDECKTHEQAPTSLTFEIAAVLRMGSARACPPRSAESTLDEMGQGPAARFRRTHRNALRMRRVQTLLAHLDVEHVNVTGTCLGRIDMLIETNCMLLVRSPEISESSPGR